MPSVTLLLLGVLFCGVALAQVPKANPPLPPEITVTAPRGETSGGIAPLLQLAPAELESYGVDTLADLVDALRPMTRSSRSDAQAVVLINGHLAGQGEFDNLPREAIERVEVLPESVALQYGFSESQRVLNIILKQDFRAVPARINSGTLTEGGGQSEATDTSVVRLADEARATLLAAYIRNDRLLESERGIDLPDSAERTLLPEKTDVKVSGTVSHPILGVSASFEASLDLAASKSLQGLGDFGRVLDQTQHQNTSRYAGQLTGQLGHFVWGATASLVHVQTHAASQTGVDAGGDTLFDLTRSSFNAGTLQLSLSGPVASLPAGLVVANGKFGLQYQGFESEDHPPGAAPMHSNLVRSVRSLSFNTRLPLASRDRQVLPKLGDLAGTLNVGVDNVSDFGSLWSLSYGLDWAPLPKLHLDAILTDKESAPTVQQVLSPPIFTPNVEMFDFVKGETVSVTTITGGGGNLARADDREQSFGISLGPFFGKSSFSAHFVRSRLANAVGALPPLTADVEAAFPERFARAADGTLVEVDNRWINLAHQSVDDLKWGALFWLPLGAPPDGKGSPNRIELSLFDTWYLHDVTLVRNGVPPLDLLNGAPFDLDGGQPRHKVEFRALLFKDGIGTVLNVHWNTGTSVGGAGDLGTLHFSALGTADLRTFCDFERVPGLADAAWAKSARVSLLVVNLFDRRVSVRDGEGATPVAFSKGYVDPGGRTLWLTLRKVF